MLKILAACGNGMGTSMIIKIKVQKALKNLGVDGEIEATSVGQAKGIANQYDILICSSHLVDQFENIDTKIAKVTNLMDDQEITAALEKALASE